MTATKQESTVDMGLKIKGLIMGKSIFKAETGDKFSLDIACPGSGLRSMLSIGVDEVVYNSVSVMDIFDHKISYFLSSKGRLYFNHATTN